jgi:hypothetical protein
VGEMETVRLEEMGQRSLLWSLSSPSTGPQALLSPFRPSPRATWFHGRLASSLVSSRYHSSRDTTRVPVPLAFPYRSCPRTM